MNDSKGNPLWALPIFALLALATGLLFLFYGINGYRAGQVTVVVLTAVVVLTLGMLFWHAFRSNKELTKKTSTSSVAKTFVISGVAILIGIWALIMVLVIGKGLSGGS